MKQKALTCYVKNIRNLNKILKKLKKKRLIIRVVETIDGHCGYEFSWSPYRLLPLSGSSEYHNYHHSHNVGNFGSWFSLWDTLFSTNKDYFAFKAKKDKVFN